MNENCFFIQVSSCIHICSGYYSDSRTVDIPTGASIASPSPSKLSGMRGGYAGLTTILRCMQTGPVFEVTWPVHQMKHSCRRSSVCDVCILTFEANKLSSSSVFFVLADTPVRLPQKVCIFNLKFDV